MSTAGGESFPASQGTVGKTYLTESQNQVEILRIGPRSVRLRSQRLGHCVEVPMDFELYPARAADQPAAQAPLDAPQDAADAGGGTTVASVGEIEATVLTVIAGKGALPAVRVMEEVLGRLPGTQDIRVQMVLNRFVRDGRLRKSSTGDLECPG